MSRIRLTTQNKCHTPVVGGEAIEALIDAAAAGDDELDAWMAAGGTLDAAAHPQNGITALHALCRTKAGKRDALAMERLLRRGARTDRRNLRHQTPLLCAVTTRQVWAVELLLAYGADPTAADKKGMTPSLLLEEEERKLKAFPLSAQNTRLWSENLAHLRALVAHGLLRHGLEAVGAAKTIPSPRKRRL